MTVNADPNCPCCGGSGYTSLGSCYLCAARDAGTPTPSAEIVQEFDRAIARAETGYQVGFRDALGYALDIAKDTNLDIDEIAIKIAALVPSASGESKQAETRPHIGYNCWCEPNLRPR